MNSNHLQPVSRVFIWLTAFLSLGVLVAAIRPRYYQLAVVSDDPAILSGQLRQMEAEALVEIGLTPSRYALYFTGLEAAAAFTLLGIGVVVLWLRPHERMATIFGLAMTTFGLVSSPLTDPLLASSAAVSALVDGLRLIGFAALVFTFLLFPNGEFAPGWTRWLGIIWLVYLATAAFLPQIRLTPSIVWASSSQAIVFGWALLWLLIIAAVQVYRYRNVSNPAMRQQSKWVVFGVATYVGLSTLVMLPHTAATVLDYPLTTILRIRLIAFSVILLSSLFLTTAIGVAILRYRLWDIDVIIRKTLVYALLTATLALIYFGSVTLMQSLFSAVSGQQSPVATVLSTLLIAALFSPLRRSVQQGIDRRFYRQKYDAQQVLADFAVTARDETDLDALTAELARVVGKAIQPEQITVWLQASPTKEYHEF